MFNFFKRKTVQQTKGGEKQMLKVKVHGEKKEEPMPELNLRVLSDKDGAVLVAVDAKGEPITGGSIIRITNEGTLVRVPHLSAKLGIKLNEDGQILQVKPVAKS
jgi:hypothetical protein